MPESNPVAFTVLTDAGTPTRIGLELEVYSASDPTVIIDIIPRRTGLSALDELKNSGGGSFSIMQNDAKLKESPNLLEWRNVVKCRLDTKVVGGFLIQSKEADYASALEHAGEAWNIAGEGLRSWLRDAVVLPYGGLKEDSQSSRVFSFASERGSWYKPADWVEPVKIAQHTLDPGTTNPWGTAPAEWPDAPLAYWVWGVANSPVSPAPLGVNFFRFEFEVLGTGLSDYSIFCAADDDFDVYVDAAQVITSRDTAGYAQTWRADFQLGPGTHVLAARVQNNSGVAALIAALFKAGDAATETAAVLITVTGDAGWVVNSYPDPSPGWSPGEILLTLLGEAQARGVRFPTFLTPTFTADVDSDGATWARSLDWEFDVGSEYFDVVARLEEVVCDLWIDPDTLELNMYSDRGSHRDVQSTAVQPVKFEIGRNVTKAGEDGVSDIKNTLLIEHTLGYGMAADGLTTSITDYGRVEGFISTGASPSVSSDVAQKVFSQKAEPETSATFEIIDVDDARPFVDFFVGDWVLAPGKVGLEPRRVMSLSVAEDSKTGEPTFSVELDTIFEDRDQRYERWLKSASTGTLGGTLANTSSGGGGGGTPNAQTTQRGPQGLQGVVGPIGIRWEGVWSSGSTYTPLAAVSYLGSSWLCVLTNTNVPPTGTSAEWKLIAAAGTNGTDAVDGREVELQKTPTEIQWRYVGDPSWVTLVALLDIKGDPGTNGTGLVYRGDWDALTQYVQNDIVTHASAQWVTSVTTTGSEPGVGTDWDLYAGGGGALPTRATVVYTTASLATEAEETGTQALAVGYRLLKIETNGPARVRLYATPAYRTVDASRAVGTDPTGDHGLIFDFVSTNTVLSAVLSPVVDGMNTESPATSDIPLAVQNLDTVAASVTVTLTWIQTE